MTAIALGFDATYAPQLPGQGLTIPPRPQSDENALAARGEERDRRSGGDASREQGNLAEAGRGVYIAGARSPRGELLEEMLRRMSVPEDGAGQHVDIYV